MGIYIESCTISMLIAYFMPKLRYKGQPLHTWLQVLFTILPLVLVTGLRYGIGTDYFLYERLFNLGDSSWEARNLKAPVYYNIFNNIIQYFNGDFAASVFIIAGIFFFLIFYRVFEDSPYPWLSVFLIFGMLYFFVSMNAMRQSFGMAILMFSLRYLEKKQNIKFFICLAIAVGIHTSLIAFMLVFFLYKSKINIKIIAICTPLIFALVFASKNYLVLFSMLLGYEQYIGGQELSGTIVWANFIWQLCIIVFACYLYNGKQIRSQFFVFKSYFCTQLIALWCYPLLLLLNGNEFMRVLWIFGLPGIVFTPMLTKKIQNISVRIFVIIMVLICFSINIYINIAQGHAHEVVPYNSIFNILR